MDLTAKKLPKVLIDARMVSSFEHGISRYVTDIASGFASSSANLRFEPVFVLSSRERSALAGRAPWTDVSVVWAEAEFLHPREWVEIPRILKSVGAAAFHSPSFASFPWMPVPYMVTVHDLIHLRFGSLTQRAYYASLLKRFAKRARVLATVSRAARAEIASWLELPVERIEIHPNAVAAPRTEGDVSILSRGGLRAGEYFVAIANDKPHKNLEMIRRAHKASGSSIPLVIAHEFLDRVDSRRKDPEAFNVLFSNARAVISPSLEEGFGRVPVEAVLAGLPLLLSKIPAHVEIFEGLPLDGIEFCDPLDLSCWIEAIRRLSVGELARPSTAAVVALASRFDRAHLMAPLIQAYGELLSLGVSLETVGAV